MTRLVVALVAAALLVGAGLFMFRPATVESAPSWPCTEKIVGRFTTALVYSPPGYRAVEGSWDVYYFTCTMTGGGPAWLRDGYPIRSLKTQDEPSGYVYTHEFDDEGPVIIPTGFKNLKNPLSKDDRATFSEEGTVEVRQIIARYSSAADICSAVDEMADNVTPANMYYVDGEWYYIWAPHLTDLPLDARMSNIWRSVPECQAGPPPDEVEDEDEDDDEE